MYITYGSYQFSAKEANLMQWNLRPRYNARGFRIATKIEAHVSGEFVTSQSETEYDITTKLNALNEALSEDFQDFGLRHTDGTHSSHFIENGHPDNLTGNLVTYRSFPAGHGGEYATGREFAFRVEAEFYTPTSVILDYKETLTHEGTTGPRVRWFNPTGFSPFWVRTHPATTQTLTQSGYAITLGSYLSPPAPLFPFPYEHEDQRVITRIGPVRYARGVEAYVLKWTYKYESDQVMAALPTVV